ncbi:MAG: YjfB family protein [Eubacterium sp.]|nr:YjfB family protein [Eubacterium sp.]
MEISDGMDIARYASLAAGNATMEGVGIAMMSKALDMQEQMGAEITQMMEQSVNPHVGGNVDFRV